MRHPLVWPLLAVSVVLGALAVVLLVEREPAASQDPPVVVVAAGDITCAPTAEAFGGDDENRCQHRETARLAASVHPDAVLPLGDLQYEEGEEDDFDDAYELAWGGLRGISRPVPGNHEYGEKDADGYFDYFLERVAPDIGKRGKGWYSYDLGDWHLIALNSNCEFVDCSEGSEQEQWLREDLAATDARCVLAYLHHPLFSNDRRYPEVRPLWRALHEAGADVVLSSHEHNYQRFARLDPEGTPVDDGLRSFVVGTGGKDLSSPGEPAEHNEAQAQDFGLLRLLLYEASYEWSFLTTGGETLDSGRSSCSE